MSTPRYRWWSYAKAMVRAYPGLHKELQDLHEQNTTAVCSGMPGGGGTSRAVENIALKQLPGDAQKEHDAVAEAVEITAMLPNGTERIEVIRLVLWKQSHTIAGAANQVHCSTATAKRWHSAFIRLVGKCYGFES